MLIITDPAEMQAHALGLRASGRTVGLVPTMGFLHVGHTSLMDIARPRCDQLVASIFVNPLQFGANEDLSLYPRSPDDDAEKCRKHGVDVLFMPPDIYEAAHRTSVTVSGLTDVLCGINRAVHFGGVTTVVARLFGLVQPTVAVFGEKDFQQLVVIRRMARDLGIPVEVLGGPLVRDDHGIALSSRNAYLTPAQVVRARTLSLSLRTIAAAVTAGERDAATLVAAGRAVLDVDDLHYLEIRAEDDLSLVPTLDGRAVRAFVAGMVGIPRLIDNLALPSPGPT
jgi:pantoate--beta-alanine ligase